MDKPCPIEGCACNFGGGCHKSEMGDDDDAGSVPCYQVLARHDEPNYDEHITRGCEQFNYAFKKYNKLKNIKSITIEVSDVGSVVRINK